MGRPIIRTERLRLVGADLALARAAVEGPGPLGDLLGAEVPASWPPRELTDALGYIAASLEADARAGDWPFWYVMVERPAPDRPELVGAAGFKGSPRPDGTVEVGYGIVDDRQRRGYASEAVAGLVRWAFSHPEVSRVTAHTFERHDASVGVLRKNGFVVAGPGTEPVDESDRRGRGELLLFELRREDWRRSARAPLAGARIAGPGGV